MKSVNGRAGIQTHKCFLLKTDVIQENRGGMDFSKEDGAAIKARNSPAGTQVLCGLYRINTGNVLVLIIPTALFLESNLPQGTFEVLRVPGEAWGEGLPLLEPCSSMLPKISRTQESPPGILLNANSKPGVGPEFLHF